MADFRVYLMNWDADARDQRAEQLSRLGFEVVSDIPSPAKLLRELETMRPSAIVIDLTRIPSQGRDFGVALRTRKGTRHIPLVFVGGAFAKVENTREVLPDAEFCDWDEIQMCLTRAIERGDREDVFVPDSVFAAYAEKPLTDKLGIAGGDRVFVANAPENLSDILDELPPEARITSSARQAADLAIWFSRSKGDIVRDLKKIAALSQRCPVWIAWPKKASGVRSDLTQAVVRQMCMDAGMVDYKICSIDKIWSALLFTYRGK